MYKWKTSGYVTYPEEASAIKLPISQEELIGLAFVRHKRNEVVRAGLSFLGSFDGRHRSGKSLAAATFAYLWDPTFYPNFNARIVRDHREFFDAWENVAKCGIDGAVVQVDEAGVSMASSDWYETWLKHITKMVQMFGYLHPVVLFVAPIKDFVDSRLRKMFQGYFKVRRYNSEYSCIYPYDVEFNTIRNKWFYRKPKIRIMDQERYITRIILSRPPDFLIDSYVKFELSNKPRMIQELQDDLKKADANKQKHEVDINKTIEFVCANYKLFESEKSKPDNVILSAVHVSFYFKVPIRTAQYIVDMAKKKIRAEYKLKMEGVKNGGSNTM